MLYCCEDHVELALEVIIDTTETAPVLEKVTAQDPVRQCKYCNKRAVYIVSNK